MLLKINLQTPAEASRTKNELVSRPRPVNNNLYDELDKPGTKNFELRTKFIDFPYENITIIIAIKDIF